MDKNVVKLDKDLESIFVDLTQSDISVYQGDVEQPTIQSYHDIETIEGSNKVIITEKESESKTVNMNNFTIDNSKFNIFGEIHANNISMDFQNVVLCHDDRPRKIELIIPKESKLNTLDIRTKSGDISIEDLLITKLMLKTMNGDISLENIDVIFAKMKTKNGDIKASILESILNYKLYLQSMNGTTREDTDEAVFPDLLNEKHELDAQTMNGDIDVVFRGKK